MCNKPPLGARAESRVQLLAKSQIRAVLPSFHQQSSRAYFPWQKSVHANQMLALERKYNGFTYIFDIGGSYESQVELYGGKVTRVPTPTWSRGGHRAQGWCGRKQDKV